jgi:ferredoxin
MSGEPDGPLIPRLRLNPALCQGIGYCAEIVPELIRLDDWGYPILDSRPLDEAHLLRHSLRAVAQCPRVALALTRDRGRRRG